jgi:hypothetical protein
MLFSVFQYLIESTLYISAFLIIYKLLFAGLTHFTWMRLYLLVSLVLSVLLPLITLPAQWYQTLLGSGSIERPLTLTFLHANASSSPEFSGGVSRESSPIAFGAALAYLFTGTYISGAFFRLIQLTGKLFNIRSSIKHHQRERWDNFWVIPVETQTPAYSFMNYIFINKNRNDLNSSEMERIFTHETIHARQWHTLDILFTELVSAIFWFNPLMKLFRTHLLEVHEYIADEKTIKNNDMKKPYSHLLLKLTTEGQPVNLFSGFSAKMISRRIKMMDKVRSLPGQKLLFFLLLPIALFLLMSFSYFENRSSATPVITMDQASEATASYQLKIGKISWEGNTIYTDSRLTEELGIKPGDAYSKDRLNERLWLDKDAVSSLYMDQGYLFFYGEVIEEPQEEGVMDLTIKIYEGTQAKIGQITIKGNGSVPEQDVLDALLINPGELFSKTNLINSAHAIQQMNKFDPEKILINPIPKPDQFNGEFAIVDIEFVLTEK